MPDGLRGLAQREALLLRDGPDDLVVLHVLVQCLATVVFIAHVHALQLVIFNFNQIFLLGCVIGFDHLCFVLRLRGAPRSHIRMLRDSSAWDLCDWLVLLVDTTLVLRGAPKLHRDGTLADLLPARSEMIYDALGCLRFILQELGRVRWTKHDPLHGSLDLLVSFIDGLFERRAVMEFLLRYALRHLVYVLHRDWLLREDESVLPPTRVRHPILRASFPHIVGSCAR